MSGVNGVGGNRPVHMVVNQPMSRPTAAESADRTTANDKLELSGVSHLLKSLKGSGVRTDKVANIRAQIEKGTYEDDHKLNVAVGRLLEDLDL